MAGRPHKLKSPSSGRHSGKSGCCIQVCKPTVHPAVALIAAPLLVPQAAGNVPSAMPSDGNSAPQLAFALLCACQRPHMEAATGAAKGDIFCACRVLHTRLADRCPAGHLGNQVKHHQFNLKLTYRVGYLARSKTSMTLKGTHNRLLSVAWGRVLAAMLQALISDAKPRCTALAVHTPSLSLLLAAGADGGEQWGGCALFAGAWPWGSAFSSHSGVRAAGSRSQ